MEHWTEYFPPLNLFNYSLAWQWQHLTPIENLSDGDDRFRHGEIAKEATR